MKVTLLVVGKTADKRLAALIDGYTARLGHYLPFEMKTVPEPRNTKALTERQQKEREGELLRREIGPGDLVLLLDEGGQELRSVEFAAFLEKRAAATRRMVFVIGGPYGFSPEVYALAAGKLSLSRMTFSHQMVRLFFVEQLYRAMTILRGEPYHHE